MSDKTANIIFKIAGILNIPAALLMLCIFVLVVLAGLGMGYANLLMAPLGESEEVPVGLMLVTLAISGVSFLLHGASVYGFIAMKKWLPIVFSIVVPLLIVDFFMQIAWEGVETVNLLNIIFLGLWVLVLALTWSKRKLFKN